ncbi:MAG: single-stranded DNA-binding protein [Bradymonadia bacterium]
MSSVNKVTLIGRLGADPEVRYTQGGQPVASLRMATSENWTDRDGQRKERTEWHSITVWGKQAELCGQYLAKGRQVYVEGRLQTREYTDREGINRKAVDIVANQIVFLGGRSESGDNQGGWGQGGGNNQGGGANQGGWGQSNSGGNQGGWGQSNSGGNQGGWGQSNSGGNQGGWGQSSESNQGTWGQTKPATSNDGSDGQGGDDPIPF